MNYKVHIYKTYKQEITVDAESSSEALAKVKINWAYGKYSNDDAIFDSIDFDIVQEVKV